MVNSRQIPTTLNWLQDKNSLTHQPASTAFFFEGLRFTVGEIYAQEPET